MHTLIDLVAGAAARYGERPALVMRAGLRDELWTYAELWRAVNAVAAWVIERKGLAPGERVLLCAPNQPRLVAALCGAMLARLIPVPLDPFTSREFAQRVARDTEAALLIAARPLDIPGVAQAALGELPLEGEALGARQPPGADDVAELVYTSGTTGRPKGVMLTHRNIVANARSADSIVPHDEPWRLLSLLPLSHMLEQTVGLFAQLYRGCTVVYGVAHQPASVAKALRRYRIDAMVVVPQLLMHMLYMLENEARQRHAWWLWRAQHRVARHLPFAWRRVLWRRALRGMGGRLRVLMCGGAPLPSELERAWERLGVRVAQGYGATECAPIVTGNTLGRSVAGSIGRPVAGVEVRLSPEGEIQVRGANVTPGYWRDEPATRAAFTPDGWYRTGDLAAADAEGNYYIRGRLRDMVVLPSGLNVFLEDLEQALERQPGVRACVVLDVALPTGGVGFNAVVIGERAEEAMRAANSELATHQRISAAVIWDAADFPRTGLGKVKRAEVRAWFERRAQGTVAAPAPGGTADRELARALSEVSGVEPRLITPQSDLNLDLALTSLARVELALVLEERLGIALDDEALAAAETVAQLAELLRPGSARGAGVPFADWPLRPATRIARAALQYALLFPLHALLARPFRVEGAEHLRGLTAPALFIANHASHVDTVSILRALPWSIRRRLAVAAAADYFYRVRALGWVSSLVLNTFPFSRKAAVRASLEHCGRLADEGWSVLIYPEGTRSPSGELLPFKSGIGLLATGLRVPIVPVAVLGGYRVLPKGRLLPHPGTLRVRFGTPVRLAAGVMPAQAVAMLHDAVAALLGAVGAHGTR